MQVQMRVEQTMNMQDRQLFNFLNDRDTFELFQISSLFNDYFQLVARVRENLNRLLIYDLGIDDYILVNYRNGWYLSMSGILEISDMPDKDFINSISSHKKGSFWYADFSEKDDKNLSGFRRWFLPNTVKFIRSYPVFTSTEGFASISIPCSYFCRMLAEDSLSTGG
jgi:hypothetical protein